MKQQHVQKTNYYCSRRFYYRASIKMQFIIPKLKENILTLIRQLGYRLLPGRNGEFNCVRSLSGLDYPRFHFYLRENKDNLVFSLHLDQKKPSYSGATAHSGEYDGELIEREVARIKNQLESDVAI